VYIAKLIKLIQAEKISTLENPLDTGSMSVCVTTVTVKKIVYKNVKAMEREIVC
jgi:hypothetical protein